MTSPAKPAIAVTGASTGIGAATARLLLDRGFAVIATVRKESDGADLDARGARVLLMDAAVRESVAAFAAAVGSAPLAGLVNNAGIAVPGPLEFISRDDLSRQFEVNVLGLMDVTRRLLPNLRQARGRIVNVSSIAGRSSLPMMGAYSASKFAVEALSDALRVELRPWGMKVVLIEPGPVKTAIWGKGDGLVVPPEAEAMYGKLIALGRKVVARAERDGIAAEEVAEAIWRGLTLANPRARYCMGPNTRVRRMLESLPAGLRDWVISRAI